MPDFNAICTVMRCGMANIVLKGCSACIDSKNVANKMESNEMGVPSSAQKGPETTTPDWIGLCVVFCSQGQGGSACNCDKLPLRMSLLSVSI